MPHDAHVPPTTPGLPQKPATQAQALIAVEPAGLAVLLPHGTHVGAAELSFQKPAGHPALGTQNLFVASHHVPAPQSEASTAHTVEAASVGLMQQHRRWSGPFDAAQVETPPFGQ